jgi:hypothetical protein
VPGFDRGHAVSIRSPPFPRSLKGTSRWIWNGPSL